MGCCESNDDTEMLDTHNDDNAADKKQYGGCCGTSGCGIKMWIMMAIVVAVIWYFAQS